MQLSYVFIAFMAREVRFPHGFIACSLFIFLRCQSALRGRFLKLLGAPWALYGGPWEQLLRFWVPLGIPLVIILVSWGALWRSHGSLGMTLAVILMVFMSKPSSGHNFDGLWRFLWSPMGIPRGRSCAQRSYEPERSSSPAHPLPSPVSSPAAATSATTAGMGS